MDKVNITQQIANNFYNMAISLAPTPKALILTPEIIKKFYVVWDGEKVEDLATGKKVSEHNKEEKLAKFDFFKKAFLENKISSFQILVVKDTNHSEYLIIDGIHRSVGFYMAYLSNKSISSRTNISCLLFESDRIHEMLDYQRLLNII